MTGALLGGVLISVSEALAGLLIVPSAKSMFSFGLLILVLLLRPQGLLGKVNIAKSVPLDALGPLPDRFPRSRAPMRSRSPR